MTSSKPIDTIASVATSSPVESLYQVIIIENTDSGIFYHLRVMYCTCRGCFNVVTYTNI
jgi:hypothetical protein